MTSRLDIQGVRKSFGATQALRKVDLNVAPAEIHALIGENGAGKSTLMKILSGAHSPDAGVIYLDGRPFSPSSPAESRRAGVAMIYQELNLAPHLSVEENILLGQEPSAWGWVNRRQRRQMARQALEELDYAHLPLEAPVSSRTLAEQQIVEIARALLLSPRVLILDEPTSSLTQVDTQRLFAVLRRLKERGVSVVYISHFLEECRSLCDRFTVLRDGQSVGAGDLKATAMSALIQLMVGREVSEIYPHPPRNLGPVALEFQALAGRVKPRAASLTLRRGEVMGVAGLVGAGRSEMVRAAFGLDRLAAGRVLVCSQDRTRSSPAGRLRDGVGLLTENRKEEGLLLQRSVADNLMLSRFGPVSSWGLVRKGQQRREGNLLMQRLKVKARDCTQAVGELSGGNQQKVFLGRLLHHGAEILLLDEPTRGIDVGSKTEIYRLINELAAQGKAILFVSSYLPELMGICDSLAVMARGVLGEKRPISEWTEAAVIEAAVGKGNS